MSRTITTTAWLATAGLLLTGCAIGGGAAGSPSVVERAQPATAKTGLPPTADDSADMLAQLSIDPERNEDSYDRDDWPHWTVIDGCDTRARTLKIHAHANAPFETTEDCTVTGGAWSDSFNLDGYLAPVIDDPDDVDIDHVVPLAEAHRSGAHSWSETERERYANDIDMVLVTMASSANRAKGDSDPASWMPVDECLYATHWIDIKAEYGLTVDQAEHAALLDALHTCPDR